MLTKLVRNADLSVSKTTVALEEVDVSVIDKRDGKHIICAPTQTGCNMGCLFCQLTGSGRRCRNLTADELVSLVSNAVDTGRPIGASTLLVSFMGSGEPLANVANLVDSMIRLRARYASEYSVVRFAIASIVPSTLALARLADLICLHGIDCKLHLSLHSTDNNTRRKIIPNAGSVSDTWQCAKQYAAKTGCALEIHWTLIEGVNDSLFDVDSLADLTRGVDCAVKVLDLHPVGFYKSEQYPSRARAFVSALQGAGMRAEYYVPPGRDIGASCGQFWS